MRAKKISIGEVWPSNRCCPNSAFLVLFKRLEPTSSPASKSRLSHSKKNNNVNEKRNFGESKGGRGFIGSHGTLVVAASLHGEGERSDAKRTRA